MLESERGQMPGKCLKAVHFKGEMRQIRLNLDARSLDNNKSRSIPRFPEL